MNFAQSVRRSWSLETPSLNALATCAGSAASSRATAADMNNETTVTKGERFYTVAINGIVVAQSPVAQGAADYLWAMRMKARWMIYHESESIK